MQNNHRHQGAVLWLLVVGIVLAAGLVFLIWRPEQGPAYTPERAEPVRVATPRVEPEDVLPERAPELTAPVSAAPTTREGTEPPPRTRGVIAGMVQVDPALHGKLRTFEVLLEEAVNEEATDRPLQISRFRHAYELSPSGKNGSFELTRVPFSRYGWRILVLAPNVSGEESIVQLSAERPRAEVFLWLRPPSSAHIVVKDQDRHPREGVDVVLRPIGRPHHRDVLTGKTDPYGFVLWETALQGKYRLILGPETNPLLPPKEITVGNERFYEQVMLPRGGNLTVEAVKPGGFPLDGVEVVAIARDSKIYRRYEGHTDKTGKAALQHLPPGRYYVHLTKKGYDRGFDRVTVEDRSDNKTRVTLRYDLTPRR